MRAVMARGPGAFAVEDVPEPVVPAGEWITCESKVSCGRCRYWALPPGARVHRVPGALPAAAAVLAEPMACVVRPHCVGPTDAARPRGKEVLVP